MKKKVKLNHDVVTFALVVLLYAVVAFLLYSGSLTRQIANMLIPISVYIVLAVSLNLVVGLLGELSLGHGGFLSVGLFSGCLVAIALSATSLPLFVRLPLSMIVGGLVAMVFGFIVGLPALRLKGDYLRSLLWPAARSSRISSRTLTSLAARSASTPARSTPTPKRCSPTRQYWCC